MVDDACSYHLRTSFRASLCPGIVPSRPSRTVGALCARKAYLYEYDRQLNTYIYTCMHACTYTFTIYVYIYIYIYIYIYTYTYTHTHIYIHMFVYIYMFVYMQSIVRAKTWEDRVSLQVVCSQTISLLVLGVTHFLSPKDSSALFRHGG